jgi:hypothetical protein
MSKSLVEQSKESGPVPQKKKGIQFYGYFSILFTFGIACAGAAWEFYAYYPQYYLVSSLILLLVAGIIAYVILTKAIKI